MGVLHRQLLRAPSLLRSAEPSSACSGTSESRRAQRNTAGRPARHLCGRGRGSVAGALRRSIDSRSGVTFIIINYWEATNWSRWSVWVLEGAPRRFFSGGSHSMRIVTSVRGCRLPLGGAQGRGDESRVNAANSDPQTLGRTSSGTGNGPYIFPSPAISPTRPHREKTPCPCALLRRAREQGLRRDGKIQGPFWPGVLVRPHLLSPTGAAREAS